MSLSSDDRQYEHDRRELLSVTHDTTGLLGILGALSVVALIGAACVQIYSDDHNFDRGWSGFAYLMSGITTLFFALTVTQKWRRNDLIAVELRRLELQRVAFADLVAAETRRLEETLTARLDPIETGLAEVIVQIQSLAAREAARASISAIGSTNGAVPIHQGRRN